MMKKNSIMFMLLLITSTIIFACSNDEDLAFPEEDNKVGKLTSSSQEEDDIQDFFSKSKRAELRLQSILSSRKKWNNFADSRKMTIFATKMNAYVKTEEMPLSH